MNNKSLLVKDVEFLAIGNQFLFGITENIKKRGY